jgi:hypothetical protein
MICARATRTDALALIVLSQHQPITAQAFGDSADTESAWLPHD